MTVPEDGIVEYRRIRAPQGNGDQLIDPPLAVAANRVPQNAQLSRKLSYDVGGRPLHDLARTARRELVASAKRYTSGDASLPTDEDAPLIVTGHQPHLFHPGVWFKNFVAHAVAQEAAGRAIHLIIDNDLARESAIRVPGGGDGSTLHSIAYDRAPGVLPYEERAVTDEALFRSFAERVLQALPDGDTPPLVDELWRRAVAATAQYRRLGECLAAARRGIEQSWGVHNLELPLSEVCRQRPFLWFTAHLLERIGDLHATYNAALLEYRRVNRIRSRTHPVPQLQVDGDWLETPFWIWTDEDPRRRGLFVRRHRDGHWELSDRQQLRWTIEAGRGRGVADAVAQIESRQDHYKLRPRALITTMYARLVLGDLFVHGIGGAKYDQLTDRIIQRFFAAAPPSFVTATATLRLPLRRTAPDPARLREVQRLLRQTVWQPERFVDLRSEAGAIVQQKAQWIRSDLPRGRRKPRHAEITRLNTLLQPFVEPRRQQLLRERDQLLRAAREERTLGSREFAFCLFPEESLRAALLDI